MKDENSTHRVITTLDIQTIRDSHDQSHNGTNGTDSVSGMAAGRDQYVQTNLGVIAIRTSMKSGNKSFDFSPYVGVKITNAALVEPPLEETSL